MANHITVHSLKGSANVLSVRWIYSIHLVRCCFCYYALEGCQYYIIILDTYEQNKKLCNSAEML